MPKPILNIADVEFRKFGHGANMPGGNAPEKFSAQLGEIGRKIGAQKLGYTLTVVPAGKRAFPYHSHRVNEEMFFIVEGEGEVRIGKETFPIKKGDVISHPPGGPETAHQIVNTGTAELRYLVLPLRPDGTKGWSEMALAQALERSLVATTEPGRVRLGVVVPR